MRAIRGPLACLLIRLAALGMFVTSGVLAPTGSRPGAARAEDKPAVASSEPAGAAKGQDIDGDPLPAGVVARLGTKRFRTDSSPVAMTYLADGKTLLQIAGRKWYGGMSSGALQYRDPLSGRLLREKQFSDTPPELACVSVAGDVFATSRSTLDAARNWINFLAVFDLPSSAQKMQMIVPGRGVEHNHLALSPNGRTLALGERSLHLIDIASQKEIAQKDIVGGEITSLAFSPDGGKLAIGGPGMVLIWTWAANEKPVSIAIPHDQQSSASRVAAVAFSPDGAAVAVGNNDNGSKGVLLYDAANGEMLRSLAVPGVTRWYFRTLEFSPNGKLLAANIEDNSGNGVALWDVATGKLVRRLFGLFGDAYYLAFSPDSRQLAAAGAWRATMCVWNLETFAPVGAELQGHDMPPNSIRFLPDDRQLATASDDYTIRVWNLVDSRQERAMRHVRQAGTYDSGIRAMDLSPDGKYIVSSSFDDTVRVWETATGRDIYRLPGHGHVGAHRAVRFTPDSKQFASWGDDMRVYLWDVATGKAVKEFVTQPAGVKASGPLDELRGPSSSLEAACFSSDASVLYMLLDGIRRFSVRTGEELPKIEAPGGTACRIAVSPDNRYVLWNVHGKFERVALSNGIGSRMVTKNHPVELRSLPDGKIVTKLDLPGTWDDVIAFSPDGGLVALAVIDDRYSIELRKIPDLSEVSRIELPSRAWAVEFSHSGKLLAASISDSTVLVWDIDHLPPTKSR